MNSINQVLDDSERTSIVFHNLVFLFLILSIPHPGYILAGY